MKHIVLSIILFVCVLLPAAAGFSKKIADGNKLFDEGSFDKALTKYNDAQIENPASPEIFFNMGAAYYRQKKYKEAVDVFQKSMEKGDVELEAKALYNIGNALFQQGQLREALEYYKQSLEREPDDEDTKYNIEYTERKIKEMLSKAQQTKQKAMQEQAQHQQQEQQAGKSGQEDKNDKDKQQGSQAVQSAGEKKDREEQAGREEGKDKSEQAKGSKPDDKEEMSEEEARRFLSAYDQDQKNLTPPMQQGSERAGEAYVEKDW